MNVDVYADSADICADTEDHHPSEAAAVGLGCYGANVLKKAATSSCSDNKPFLTVSNVSLGVWEDNRATYQMRVTKIVGMTSRQEIRKGILYLSGLIHIRGKYMIVNKMNDTKSPVVIVPFASGVSRFANAGDMAVKRVRTH